MTTPHQLPFGPNSPKSSEAAGFHQPIVTLSALDTARRMVDAASDKKAQDIILLDVRKISSLADYFVICTASVERQIRAVAEAVEEVLDDAGVPVYHREGSAADGWTLLDYGDVIIHIFSPAQRDFYRLEQLWEMAHIVVRVQ
jgi:ribosome-associated protein